MTEQADRSRMEAIAPAKRASDQDASLQLTRTTRLIPKLQLYVCNVCVCMTWTDVHGGAESRVGPKALAAASKRAGPVRASRAEEKET